MALGYAPPPDEPPPTSRSARWSAVVLLRLTAIAHLGFGVAALAGARWLQENVETIESNPNYGKLYLSLTGWGVLLVLAGLAEAGSARLVRRETEIGRVIALLVTLLGLALSFFTIAILQAVAFIPLLLLFAALYVLSYRVN